MPKEVKDIKQFLKYAANEKKSSASGPKKPANNKVLIIKQGKKITKFKLRGTSYLYTFKTEDKEKAKRLIQTLPHGIKRTEIGSKKVLNKKKKK